MIGPSGQTVSNQFGPYGQMVPKNLRDHLSMGTQLVGDHLFRGINFMGIVCPGGQEVGDWKSEDQMGSGPNASQPILKEMRIAQLCS